MTHRPLIFALFVAACSGREFAASTALEGGTELAAGGEAYVLAGEPGGGAGEANVLAGGGEGPAPSAGATGSSSGPDGQGGDPGAVGDAGGPLQAGAGGSGGDGCPCEVERSGWTASSATTFDDAAASSTLDGSTATHWTSGQDRFIGMTFELDLGRVEALRTLVLDSSGEPLDAASLVDVYLSTGDGFVLAADDAPGGPTASVELGSVSARFVRVVVAEAGAAWWSIDEVRIYR